MRSATTLSPRPSCKPASNWRRPTPSRRTASAARPSMAPTKSRLTKSRTPGKARGWPLPAARQGKVRCRASRPVRPPPSRPESSGKGRLPEAGRLHGAGLGFRRELIEPLKAGVPEAISFFELAPENWVGMGGRSGKHLRYLITPRNGNNSMPSRHAASRGVAAIADADSHADVPGPGLVAASSEQTLGAAVRLGDAARAHR
jgi:hypothetical protein